MVSVPSDRSPLGAADAVSAACALGLLGLGVFAWLPRRAGVLVFESFLARHDFGRAVLLTADRAPVLLALLAATLLGALAARIAWLRRPTPLALGLEAAAWASAVALVTGTVLAGPSLPDGDDFPAVEQVAAQVHAGMVLTLALAGATLVLLVRAVATVILSPRGGAPGRRPVLRAVGVALAALAACWPVAAPWFAGRG